MTTKTKTTLASVLDKKSQAYKNFLAAPKELDKINKNVGEVLDSINLIGCALNTLYAEGHRKKIKEAFLVDIVRQYFPEDKLDFRMRSEYRKFSTNYYDYLAFVMAFEIKSITPRYIMNKQQERVSSERLRLKIAILNRTSPDVVIDEKTGEVVTKLVKKQNVVMGNSPELPKGIATDDPSKTVSVQERCAQVMQLTNHLISNHNAGVVPQPMVDDLHRLFTKAAEVFGKPVNNLQTVPDSTKDIAESFIESVKTGTDNL